jgi:type II secretory pathway pseudopilin PulG
LSSALLALALIVSISWAIFANRRLQRQVEQMQAQATESQRRQQDLQQKVTSLTAQLQNRGLPGGEAWQGVPFIQPPGPEEISLSLTPGVERNAGATKKLVFPPSALLAKFQLYLEHDDYSAYSVSLENAEGRQLWRKDGLKSHAGPDGSRMVEFALPAPHLKPGDYLIKLSGVAANGAMEEAEDYTFSAVRR